MGLIQGKITMANGAEIPFELYPDEAPITVANFVKLIKEGYYNGKTFHRVIPHFVSQGGCPYGTGAGDLGYNSLRNEKQSAQACRGCDVDGSPRQGHRLLPVLHLP